MVTEITPAENTKPPFRARIAQASEFLKTQYPSLFAGDPRPLKIGIHLDLLERHPEMDAPGLKRALTLHCRSFRYQRKLVAGATRVDPDGNPAGEVTTEQAERAQEQLEARKKPTQRPKPEPIEPPPSNVLGRPMLRLKRAPS